MALDVTARAIVLRRSDSGESDRRIVVLTAESGKLDLVAKGARKAGSRLAGSSEPLVQAVFTWAAGRHRRFVTQVQPVTSYPGLRKDFSRLSAALALVELVDVSLPYESPAPEVLTVLETGLGALAGPGPWEAALAWTLATLLEAEGIHPEWTTCAVSGQPLAENPAWVSPRAGGYVRAELAAPFPDRTPVTAETLIALRRLGEIQSPPPALRGASECLETLFQFWRATLERPLSALEAVLRELRREDS